MTFGSVCWVCLGVQRRAQRVRTKRWSFARGIGRLRIKAKFKRPANYSDLGQTKVGAESVRRQSVSVSVALARGGMAECGHIGLLRSAAMSLVCS